jgi:hypothetical protein
MVDAGFNDLMRPAMYGSFHGMELIHADGSPVLGAHQPTVVGGPLCESGDVFTQGEGGVVQQRRAAASAGGRSAGAARYRCLWRVDVIQLQHPPADPRGADRWPASPA